VGVSGFKNEDAGDCKYVEPKIDIIKIFLNLRGVDINAGDDGEVNDTLTWNKWWSGEDTSWDCDRWIHVQKSQEEYSF